MMSNETITPSVARTAVTLANCGELAAAVFARVAGNDISTALQGETLTRDQVSTMVLKQVQRKLTARAV
jgi:hypothetical protein